MMLQHWPILSVLRTILLVFSSPQILLTLSYQQLHQQESGSDKRKHNIVGRNPQQPASISTFSSSSSSSSFYNFDVAAEEAGKILDPFSLKLTEFSLSSGGRGVQTLVRRNKGDVLLKIPLDDCILSSTVEEKYVPRNEEEYLALELIRMKTSNSYITNVLPDQHHAIWTVPSELWEEMVALGCLPRCYLESFQATRERALEFCQRVLQAQQMNNTIEAYSMERLLWAFSMVRSRSIAVPELQRTRQETVRNVGVSESEVPLALIPGLDLINHAFESGTQLQLTDTEEFAGDASTDTVREKVWLVTTSDTYDAGEQVYLSYGDEKDNWKLLITYGFSVVDNPNSIVFWRWQDLLEAARKVRPQIFSERLYSQLMKNPQLQSYILPSENRATFSFDAKTGTPRQSLSNGLIMLSNIPAQLGHTSDDTLVSDVLAELKLQRLLELQESIKGTDTVISRIKETEQHKDWLPFLLSTRTALQQELSDLSSWSSECR